MDVKKTVDKLIEILNENPKLINEHDKLLEKIELSLKHAADLAVIYEKINRSIDSDICDDIKEETHIELVDLNAIVKTSRDRLNEIKSEFETNENAIIVLVKELNENKDKIKIVVDKAKYRIFLLYDGAYVSDYSNGEFANVLGYIHKDFIVFGSYDKRN